MEKDLDITKPRYRHLNMFYLKTRLKAVGVNGAFRFAIQNPWSHDQTGTYFFFFFLFRLTHVRAKWKLFNCSVPNCSGSGKISSSLNLTREVAFSRLQDGSAVQSCCSKTSAKTRGSWEREGTAPFPRLCMSDFHLACFIFAISLVPTT